MFFHVNKEVEMRIYVCTLDAGTDMLTVELIPSIRINQIQYIIITHLFPD